jgi:redox-sensitive bicupin YhaK (pirin superfamily)
VQYCGGFRATVLAGSAFGQTAPAVLHTPLVGIDLTARAAAHTQLPLRADFEYAAIVLRGAATLAGEALAPDEWLYFAPGREALDVRCEAEAQWLLLGGVPFEEPLIIWWNLVARTQAEIESALADWNAGRFAPVRAGSSAQPLAAPSLAGVQLRGG